MNLNRVDNRMVFAISAEDVQDVAVRMLKRRLTEYEMHTAEKCIDWGLSSGLETVFRAAIETAVEE